MHSSGVGRGGLIASHRGGLLTAGVFYCVVQHFNQARGPLYNMNGVDKQSPEERWQPKQSSVKMTRDFF